jgi:hypothetical protein
VVIELCMRKHDRLDPFRKEVLSCEIARRTGVTTFHGKILKALIAAQSQSVSVEAAVFIVRHHLSGEGSQGIQGTHFCAPCCLIRHPCSISNANAMVVLGALPL